jgi:putative peptidoglycan lipid II flippase
VKSLAVGIVAGAALIVALQIGPLWRAGALPRVNLGFRHPAVGSVLGLYVPIFLGLLVNTAAVVVDRNLAWGAERDALGAMRYATTLVQMVLGLVAAAISLAILPALSRHHAAGDEPAFRAMLSRALAMTTVLIVPATLGLAAVGAPVVDLLFRHGATGEAEAEKIVIALLGYLPGTLFAAYDQLLIFAFYARRNTRTPVLVGIVAVGIYFLVAVSLVRPFGMLGLVLANSAQFVAHTVIMVVLARRAFGGVGDDHLRRVLIRCAAAGLGTALLSLLTWRVLDAGLPAASTGWLLIARELALVALPVAAGGLLYLAALHRLRVEELTALRRATLGRVLPRFA